MLTIKRILVLCLAIFLLAGCQNSQQPPETTIGQPNTQNAEEEKVLKILNIGNSHGNDSVWLLPMVLKAEMPEQEFLVGALYQSYALTEHIESAKNTATDYVYNTNSGDGWTSHEAVSIKMALADQHWDIIMFNESSRHLGLESKMSQGMIDWFRNYILDNLDYEPTLIYNMTWANPTDERFYTDTTRQNPPASFRNTYTKHYGFDRVNHYNMLVEMTKKYLVNHEGFHKIIYNAKPIQYAGEVLGVPQYDPDQKMDLYRDYTHISDFGRLMVAYNWYCQMFNINQLTEVKIDVIPAGLRATYRQQNLGDEPITDAHKAIIMESINETLKDPFAIPAK